MKKWWWGLDPLTQSIYVAFFYLACIAFLLFT